MDGKDKVLLMLIGELHVFCKEHDILYYLAETEKTAWSASLIMDSKNIKKFLDGFICTREDRGLEWAGNNHAIVGEQIKYVDLSTLYYTQARLVREKYLGMFVTIKPMSKSTSRLAKLDRLHRYLDIEDKEKRSRLLNSMTSKMHNARVGAVKGKVKSKDIAEISIGGIEVYVKKGSSFESDPVHAWHVMINRKKNNDEFICDETISYKDLKLNEDRKILAEYEKKMRIPRIKYKRGENLKNNCVQLSNASFCRFSVVTDLLQKYSYDEIESLGKESGEVRIALDAYIDRAKKLRSKKQSAYIGDRFIKVINSIYPEIDTNDLYAFTPDFYKEGIKLYDYTGNLLEVYGGSDEH